MAIIIKPVSTTTCGGYPATISGIDPANSDCLEGTVVTPGKGQIQVRWNLGGICRDTHDTCNLDMRSNEMTDLRATAEALGVKF